MVGGRRIFTERPETHFTEGPDHINVKMKVGVLELDDVLQKMTINVTLYFYFRPPTELGTRGARKVRFENIRTPDWTPHLSFANQYDEADTIDESYWVDLATGLVFGKMEIIAKIQERFDHHAFPFDRQIIDVQMLFSNCQVKEWKLEKAGRYPPELSLKRDNWLAQAELNAIADSWDLKFLMLHALNDIKNESAIVHLQIFMEREPDYYFWNIIMVYFIIIFLKVVIIAYPYTEARFDFAINLALTTVAFMFVITTMVPKTSYLTKLDKYLLTGLWLLFIRFLSDFTIQFAMEEYLPFGPEAIRASCTIENENENGVSPCQVDITITILLALIWVAYFGYFVVCTFLFPRWARPSWQKINRKVGETDFLEKEIAGTNFWDLEEREIKNSDLTDAVNYEKENADVEHNEDKSKTIDVTKSKLRQLQMED